MNIHCGRQAQKNGDDRKKRVGNASKMTASKMTISTTTRQEDKDQREIKMSLEISKSLITPTFKTATFKTMVMIQRN